MLRFCLITTFFPPLHFGGDAVFVANLANALAGDGHHVEVVHCPDSFQLLKKGVAPSQFALHPGIVVHSLQSAYGALSPVLTYATGKPFLKASKMKEILSRPFDVVHWHNISLVGGAGALRYGRGVRLCTLHDYWWICPTHILFKNGEEACVDRSCLSCTLRQRRLPQPWRSGGWLKEQLRYVDRFLAPSQFVQQQYAQSELAIQSTVLPHFVAPAPPAGPRDPSGYYLYVGRLEKAKGVQTVLPLFEKPGRRLLIAGSGEFESPLRQMARDLPQVEFLGRVDHSALAGLYAGARATIVPSICYETFGLIILESLQQKTPVLASRYGALPETIEATQGGFVYNSVSDLAQMLDRLDAHPEEASAIGEEGYRHLQPYTQSAHLAAYYQLISTC